MTYVYKIIRVKSQSKRYDNEYFFKNAKIIQSRYSIIKSHDGIVNYGKKRLHYLG